MCTWWRTPLALAAGMGLLAGTACTEEPAEPPQEGSPQPLPTAYDGEPPPGVSGEPLRFLHGPGSGGPKILDDEMGVRIAPVGDALLISSNSKEQHVLQNASDGTALWEGDQRVEWFGTDRGGSETLILSSQDGDDVTTTVVDDSGETIWSGSDPRDLYVNGVVVRRPQEWSADDPYGDFAIMDTDGEEIWGFTFEQPPEETEESEDTPDTDAPGADPGQDPDPDPERMGVPVRARGNVLLLDDGSGLLQARDLSGEDIGELLWSIAGDDPDLAGGASVPRPRPQVVGFYELPDPDEDATADEGSPQNGQEAGEGEAEEETGTRQTALVRWSLPEDPSLLSLHDLRGGDMIWSVTEPGANPGGTAFDPAPLTGAVYDSATRTLLLPQASGETPMIAVDLVDGELLWEFEDDTERAISPMFAVDGYVYGDSRGTDDSESAQVVLDAESKDVVADDLDSYVEAVTRDGHALVVQDRQRFVFPPAENAEPGVDGGGSQSPTR